MTTPRTRHRYSDPPLLEAVLEFQFFSGEVWDSVFHGRLLDRLPEYPGTETIRSAALVIDETQVGVRQAPESKRFWRADRGIAITVGPELLGISSLPPQLSEGHSWELLRTTALKVLEVYRMVVRPGAIRQVGLRYINGIAVDPTTFRLGDLVTDTSGVVPQALLEERNPFSFRLERTTEVQPTYNRREVVALAAHPMPPQGGRVVLDVDQVAVWPKGVEPAALPPVLEDMHDAVHEVFNTVIRPEVLQRFGPEDPSIGAA